MTTRIAALAATLGISLAPSLAHACACGCGVFDVGAGSMMPSDKAAAAYVEYDHMDQNRNWSGADKAPAGANDDKQIRTDFVTLGVQYRINHAWGVAIEAPVWNRTFRTADGEAVASHHDTALGDVRVSAVYTGLSEDMSTGLTLGLKLATGPIHTAGFDRDTAIGSGSTDLLLGAYHHGALGRSEHWRYFVQGAWDAPLATQGDYRPGQEIDAAAGASYSGAPLADGRIAVTPVLQVIASQRGRDSGAEANGANSGYERVLISPGVQFDFGSWRLYGDVEFPLYQRVNGNQLVAPQQFKLMVSRSF